MPLPPRLFHGDEELGKKDDDHKPGTKGPLDRVWQQRRLLQGPHRRTIRRVGLGILALIGLYYFFKNMPTDLTNPRPRPNYDHPAGPAAPISGSRAPPPVNQVPTPKPVEEEAAVKSQHYFNGPIKFYQLASTLHAVSRTKGSELINQNVVCSMLISFSLNTNLFLQLFAAASLKSAAILLPIACDMAIRERNFVHFALMGRDAISMDILKSVNGITKECKIIFHGMPRFYQNCLHILI